jgi:hypothetical protein
MTKLSDLQTILLSSASRRHDGSLLPTPDNISADAGRIGKAIAALIKQGHVIETHDAKLDHAWRVDGDLRYGAKIADAGRVAIGIEPECIEPTVETGEQTQAASNTDAAGPTKAALVLSLLHREQGATLAELVEATRWLPHTTRAALTSIRKKGHAVVRGKRDDVTCYSVAA